MWTLPNILTISRIGLIPCFLVVFYLPYEYACYMAAVVFSLAIATDWLDGFIARKLAQESLFGAFLDPVADKLMVAVVLIAVLQKQPHVWIAVPVAIIIGREIAVSALREWMAQLGQQNKITVSRLGKWKTGFQMVSLILLIIGPASPMLPLNYLGVMLLYVACALTLWSMSYYLLAAWPGLVGGAKG